MEKAFSRLAGAADASQVRTIETLEGWFKMLKHKMQRGGAKHAAYVLDQLKAIRQDLTVQRIESAFAVDVYSYNARLALEHGDEPESKVCFARAAELTAQLRLAAPTAAPAVDEVFAMEPANAGLRALQALGDGGLDAVAVLSARVPSELAACASKVATASATPPTLLLVHLRLAGQRGNATAAACAALCSSVLTLNWVAFFAEFDQAEPLVQKAAEKLHARVRLDALNVILHAHGPAIAVAALQRELGFASVDACHRFLSLDLNGIVFADGSEQKPVESATARQFVVCKASRGFSAAVSASK